MNVITVLDEREVSIGLIHLKLDARNVDFSYLESRIFPALLIVRKRFDLI